jgi:putative peptide zinc metalloprotease protein
VEREPEAPTAPLGRLARLFRPRTRVVKGADRLFKKAYESGGFLLFSKPALTALSAVAIAGLGAFGFLILRRYGTPFVVARKIGLGGLVFMVGRFLVVSLHELAHGLLLTAYGRKIERAGFRLLFIFPYAFVDTSDAWFEPRGRRVAISAAGPASDLVVGGTFALLGIGVGGGTIREIFFNLALAAYVGAFFNLNPFLDRDGYNMLVDALGEPGLRRRSKEWLAARLSGKPGVEREWTLLLYSVSALVWSVLGAGFAILLSLRYYHRLAAIAPKTVLWAVFGGFYALLFLPVVIQIARPLFERRRRSKTEVEGVPA